LCRATKKGRGKLENFEDFKNSMIAKMNSVQEAHDRREEQLKQEISELKNQLSAATDLLQGCFNRLSINPQATPVTTSLTATNQTLPPHSPANVIAPAVRAPIMPQVRGRSGPRIASRGSREHVPGCGGINDHLRRYPMNPIVPSKWPKNVNDFMAEWTTLKHSQFINATNKRDWGQATRNNYSMRLYLYKRILTKAQSYRSDATAEQRIILATSFFNNEQISLGLSLKQYFLRLKKEDPNTKQRARDPTGGRGGRGPGSH
jgi:hypothetical protein